MTDLEKEITEIRNVVHAMESRGRGHAYPATLKTRITRLLTDHDVTAKSVAETIGIRSAIICKWRRDAATRPIDRPSFKRVQVSAPVASEPAITVEGKNGLKVNNNKSSAAPAP